MKIKLSDKNFKEIVSNMNWYVTFKHSPYNYIWMSPEAAKDIKEWGKDEDKSKG